MNCLSCGAATTNGLALCELCRRKAQADLEFLPVYFKNLARWRPGHAGSRPVPGSRVLWSGDVGGSGDRVRDALDAAGNELVAWSKALTDDRGIESPVADDEPAQVAALCGWLGENLTSIATLEWCGAFVVELGDCEATLRALTEDIVPGWYAGACRLCGVPTHVVPGLTWVTCVGCGSTTYARDHLDIVIDEARGWVARPRAIAEAVVALMDTEASVPRLFERVRKWGQRGRIVAVRALDADGDEVGPKRYRMGEVLDRLSAEGATRSDVERMEA
jgi:hypothetical protein